jgi:hypothetical protein
VLTMDGGLLMKLVMGAVELLTFMVKGGFGYR